jgi:hypothetical protein
MILNKLLLLLLLRNKKVGGSGYPEPHLRKGASQARCTPGEVGVECLCAGGRRMWAGTSVTGSTTGGEPTGRDEGDARSERGGRRHRFWSSVPLNFPTAHTAEWLAEPLTNQTFNKTTHHHPLAPVRKDTTTRGKRGSKFVECVFVLLY